MARTFRGDSIHKVDAKGRVSIPASFRRALEEGDPDWTEGLSPKFVLVFGGKQQKFLEVYTKEAAAEVDDRIRKLPRGTPQRRVLENLFGAQAVELSIDDAGRMILSPSLREKIGIDDQANFIGATDTFQIWAPDDRQDQVEDLDDWISAQGDDFDPLTLLQLADAPNPVSRQE
ncbi:division/cell wall cluster transcriptional repressor MraZ [Litoreibacter roseus]|uniref:division/cell wall cluster transcriptional repressor MraZ n=1 Tax=Litoreibacter roseus TaxID=2601869 RepID=UPI00135BD7D5|nr:division/cell wall cluster transcriptional repressor MraZ [Litoreibacter roseus]